MSGRKVFHRHEKVINAIVRMVSVFPKRFRFWALAKCRNIKGKKGIALRYIFLKSCAMQCGRNVAIREMVILENVQNLKVGDNVSIHPFCYVEAIGVVEIGNDVSIAHNTSILSVNHTWNDRSIPIKYNPVEKSRVCIKDDVWIGCGCRIMAGVTIHSHSVIAAGAVVTKDVNPNVVVGGVPAHSLKTI